MSKNSNVIGVAAILLILAAGTDIGKTGAKGYENSNGNFYENSVSEDRRSGIGKILPPLEIRSILSDLHRLTSIMNRMDDLGRMALSSPERPKLPPPSEILNKAMPDLGGIIETVAPFLSSLGSSFGGSAGTDNTENKSENGVF